MYLDPRAKGLVAGAVTVAIVAAVGSGILYIANRQIQLRLETIETTLRKENQNLQERIEQLTSERRRLEGQLTETTERLQKAQHDVEQADMRYATLQTEQTRARDELETLREERLRLREQLALISGEKQALDKTSESLQQLIARLEEENRRLSARVGAADALAPSAGPPSGTFSGVTAIELPPIIVQRSGAAPAVAGTIVQVNDAFKFVVIDKGSNDGVTAGSRFHVYRGADRLGEVTAVKVRDSLTACNIERRDGVPAFRTGDAVVLAQ